MANTTLVEIKHTVLCTEDYVTFVRDDSAGAVTTFTGTTRDTFQGKRVKKLEYEAYVPMAEKAMRDICATAIAKWVLCKIAVAHRLGEVGVGEASVVIAVSSAHRQAALEACHWAIDELKAKVPIWKKEFFEDGSVWKENEEFRKMLSQQTKD